MIEIDLTPEEVEILAEVLDTALSDLRMEMADTDRMEFREILKARKAVIEKALASLGGAPPGSR